MNSLRLRRITDGVVSLIRESKERIESKEMINMPSSPSPPCFLLAPIELPWLKALLASGSVKVIARINGQEINRTK